MPRRTYTPAEATLRSCQAWLDAGYLANGKTFGPDADLSPGLSLSQVTRLLDLQVTYADAVFRIVTEKKEAVQ